MSAPHDAALAQADWSTLFDLLPIGAYRSTPDGRMLRANRALVALNGYSSEAQLIAAVHDIATEWYVDPERRAQFRHALEHEGRVVGMVSQIHRHGSRELAWISENAHLVRDARGQALFYEGTVEDISARVHTQQSLERSDAMLALLARQLPGVVYLVQLQPDGQAQFRFISDGVRALYGIEPEAVMKDDLALRRLRHPDDSARVQAQLDQSNREFTTHHEEFRIVRPDGGVRWVQASSCPIHDDKGSTHRCGLIIDVTAQHEAGSLRRARDRAQAAHHAIAALLARISHELRTPLNAVLGFSQLLAIDTTLAAPQQRYASEALAAGRHLLALVDDLLDLGRAESGEITLSPRPVDALELLQESARLVEALRQERGVTLTLPRARASAAPDATAAPVPTPLPALLADPLRLRQVLTNLLSNAIKYNRRGGWVRVEVQRQGPLVALAVADSGHGLDAAQLERLFRPFDRLGAERSAVPGTGLGLVLSRQFARAMGGDIGVRSEPGAGSCFTLTLPAAGDAASTRA